LGKNVPVETVVQKAIEEDVHLIGLSALMTTTLHNMARTIQALRKSGHPCKIMVGGAVLTPDYAEQIGADFYAKDAKASVDIAKIFFAEEEETDK
jgi:5-methyltetrahydrofolate--homocysteine methyltransferase